MTEAERAYWSIIAQVLPVLGLALVLEVRTLAQAVQRVRAGARPSDAGQVSKGQVRWLMANFVVGGVGVLLGTLAAVGALASDDAPADWVVIASQLATALALGVTLTTPLVFAVMAAEPGTYFLRLARYEPEAQRSIRRIRRKGRDMVRRVGQQRRATFEQLLRLQRLSVQVDRLWNDVERLPAGGYPHRDELLADRAAIHKETEEVRRSWRDLLKTEHTAHMFNQETLRYLHELLAVQRDASTRQMTSTLARLDVTAGLLPGSTAVPLVVLFDHAPDDGGFLSPAPMRVPEWPDRERGWLTSPEAFYPEGPPAL